MAWWLDKDYSYGGPGFDWVGVAEDPREGLSGQGLALSWPRSAKNVPKAARLRKPYYRPIKADIFIVDSCTVVNGRFKALVESFAPGVHLFVPIELQRHNGDSIDGEFYYFTTNQDVDCLLTDNKEEWFNYIETRSLWLSSIYRIVGSNNRKIYFSKPQIRGLHLWTGGPLGWDTLFVSDEFCNAIRKAKIRFVTIHRPCIEVDRPWIAEEQMGPMINTWRDFVAHKRKIRLNL